jgi:hypothetical protein
MSVFGHVHYLTLSALLSNVLLIPDKGGHEQRGARRGSSLELKV